MVILVGMTVAAMAAYYVLVEFIYPNKITDIAPVETRTETPATTTEESMNVGQNEPFKFVGVLGEVGTDCATEGECFVVVDDRKITASVGGSFGVVGEIQGVDEFADLEAHRGQLVEIYAQDLGHEQFTLRGSKDFYIKLIGS
jgi:hypothetical protein